MVGMGSREGEQPDNAVAASSRAAEGELRPLKHRLIRLWQNGPAAGQAWTPEEEVSDACSETAARAKECLAYPSQLTMSVQ